MPGSAASRRFIEGQKCTLLSRRENLTLQGRRSLKLLLAANTRLDTAHLLEESFGQLWSYRREAWARRFFDNWHARLKWQHLKPCERFADMVERHWDRIASFRKPENKVSLGFVEGLNNKMRVSSAGLTARATVNTSVSRSSLACLTRMMLFDHLLEFAKSQEQ
jgi:transposase